MKTLLLWLWTVVSGLLLGIFCIIVTLFFNGCAASSDVALPSVQVVQCADAAGCTHRALGYTDEVRYQPVNGYFLHVSIDVLELAPGVSDLPVSGARIWTETAYGKPAACFGQIDWYDSTQRWMINVNAVCNGRPVNVMFVPPPVAAVNCDYQHFEQLGAAGGCSADRACMKPEGLLGPSACLPCGQRGQPCCQVGEGSWCYALTGDPRSSACAPTANDANVWTCQQP